MAKRRAKKKSQMASKRASQTESGPYRVFDAAQVDELIINGAAPVREAIEEYESAKVVSQQVLEAQVCV